MIKRIGENIGESAQHIFTCMIKIFTTRKAIIDEALSTISTIFEVRPDFITAGSNFSIFIPFFLNALQNAVDKSIFKSALFSLGALCDSLEKNLYEFDNGKLCGEIISTLSGHLQVCCFFSLFLFFLFF